MLVVFFLWIDDATVSLFGKVNCALGSFGNPLIIYNNVDYITKVD